MKKGYLICILLFLAIMPAALSEKSMVLLAVEESAEGPKGSTAYLYLRTTEGNGQVFTATYPLTEMDTQISARFAKDIACEYTKKKCDKDFLYTIESNSSIIGGPSGGAAITIITIAELFNDNIDPETTLTGTINSGGIIGPVGGIKEKITVAAHNGLKRVLIPRGTRFVEDKNIADEENITIDLIEHGKKLGVEVIEVSTIDEAYSYFMNRRPYKEEIVPKIDPKYKETMKMLAELLCNRSEELKEKLGGELFQEGVNLTESAEMSFDKEEYYSAASYCFAANIKFLQTQLENTSYENIQNMIEELEYEKNNFHIPAYESITDLQIFMVVEERLFETQTWLDKTKESLKKSNINETYLELARNQIAYANERLASAHAWSKFFDNEEARFIFNKDAMKDGCIKKLAEAQERYQYVKIYFPSLIQDTLDEINKAKDDMKNEKYELCIFKAAKAKAESDVLLGAMGISSTYIEQIIEEKLKVVGKILSEQNTFPILAYSYYEYADNLKDENTYSSLLYAEYALELADLGSYVGFQKQALEKDTQRNVIAVILILLLLAVSLWHISKK